MVKQIKHLRKKTISGKGKNLSGNKFKIGDKIIYKKNNKIYLIKSQKNNKIYSIVSENLNEIIEAKEQELILYDN
jgi:hypothetical protein